MVITNTINHNNSFCTFVSSHKLSIITISDNLLPFFWVELLVKTHVFLPKFNSLFRIFSLHFFPYVFNCCPHWIVVSIFFQGYHSTFSHYFFKSFNRSPVFAMLILGNILSVILKEFLTNIMVLGCVIETQIAHQVV